MTTRFPPASSQPGLAALPEVRSAVAAAVLLSLAALAQATHLDVGRATLVAAVLTTGVAATLPRRHALLLGVTAWALVTGFVVHQEAQLTLAPPDLERLALLAGLALVAAALRAAADRAPGTR